MEIAFEKNGITRLVHTPAEAVQLRADGWIEVTPEPAEFAAEETDDKPNVTLTGETSEPDNDKNGEFA
ncbi:MAG TPA: hypothetical protein VG815_05530 [Chloroflexota bacterium]|jgi:hypothetical protein|nr:hypothetical protein [Chloroflexota bacterium]